LLRRAAGRFLLLAALLTQGAGADSSRLSSDDPVAQDRASRLLASESAYLRQHADNPIDWYPWSDEAFAKARREGKLIFLSIGYASCHWCHVMEAESFLDSEVADVLNRSYVSIKVDREQLPDIDAYYSLAVEAVKGESGWPISVVLLPDRSTVFAANYLSKEQLLTAFERMNQLWQSRPDDLRASAALLAKVIDQHRPVQSGENARFLDSWADEASRSLLSQIDTVHGGFGQGAKFPEELRLQFLLNRYKFAPDPGLKETLANQLDAIMNQGMSDIVYGGIFRYTTDREMTRPHFEKMLYNQALVTYLFADAARWLQRPDYQDFADAVVHFVRNFLRLGDGAYAAAIDADHAGREGGYYLWPDQGLQGVPRDVARIPFGEDRSYLFGAFAAREAGWVDSLQKFRTDEPKRIDNKITAWNALWISALLKAGYDEDAQALAETIWQSAWNGDRLLRMGTQTGFLDDYAYLSDAYWQLYLGTMDSKWKQRARLLDQRILALFHADDGLSYRSSAEAESFSVDLFRDRELPSPAAVVLEIFSRHQAEPEFIDAFEQIRALAASHVGNRPDAYLGLLQAGQPTPGAAGYVIAKGHGMIALRSTGQSGRWRLSIDLDEDWHVNAAEVLDRNLVPTRVLDAQEILAVRYPKGEELKAEFSDSELSVYSGRVHIDVETADEAPDLAVTVKLQACSNRVCLLPETHRLRASADQ
jgi:uncharacterized protein YyaL (SSP411 family)